VESYSKTVLDYLEKKADPSIFNERLALIKKAGIESVGFILVGAPVETDADFEETVRGVLMSSLDLVGVNILTPYAGTGFFDKVKDDLVFQLIPYECRFRDGAINLTALCRERDLYRRFYLRPVMGWRLLRRFLRFPLRSTRLLVLVLRSQARQFLPNQRPDVL